jgi:hypothetical protein
MRITTVISSLLLSSILVAPNNGSATRKPDTITIPRTSRDFHVEDRLELAQQVSNRCLTPYFWCYLPGFAPIGASCWCASPNGPIAGRVG